MSSIATKKFPPLTKKTLSEKNIILISVPFSNFNCYQIFFLNRLPEQGVKPECEKIKLMYFMITVSNFIFSLITVERARIVFFLNNIAPLPNKRESLKFNILIKIVVQEN